MTEYEAWQNAASAVTHIINAFETEDEELDMAQLSLAYKAAKKVKPFIDAKFQTQIPFAQ